MDLNVNLNKFGNLSLISPQDLIFHPSNISSTLELPQSLMFICHLRAAYVKSYYHYSELVEPVKTVRVIRKKLSMT